MKKLQIYICFLVLIITAVSRGYNETETSSLPDTKTQVVTSQPEISYPTLTSTSDSSSSSSANSTSVNDTMKQPDEAPNTQVNNSNVTKEISKSTSIKPTVTDVTVSMATRKTSSPPVSSSASSWGYVVLVLIILIIIVLCVILYYLRRVFRTYSFDLQRPSPGNYHSEPIGTFEPVYLDDLDRPALKDHMTTNDLSPPPVDNGTMLPSEEKDSSGDSAPQDQPDGNGVETSAVSNSSSSSSKDSVDSVPSPVTSNLIIEELVEEQQNENNNNPWTDPTEAVHVDTL